MSSFQQMSGTPFGQPSNATSAFGQHAANMGQPNNPNQAQQTSDLFGTSSLFSRPQGQQQQRIQQQPQTQQQQTSTTGAFNTQSQNPGQSQLPIDGASSIWKENRESPNQKPVQQQCEELFNRWNPQSSQTVFKHYFYNKVEPSRMPFYAPSAQDDPREWEEAVSKKPGDSFVPALATGFAGIAERLKVQRAVLAHFNARLHEINGALDDILSKHDLQYSVRALNAKRKHSLLRQRCLTIAGKVQILRNRGYAMDTDEDKLRQRLEALDGSMTDPGLSARSEELWSRLMLLRSQSDRLRHELNQSKDGDVDQGLPEDIEARAKRLLEGYDKQLHQLASTVREVTKDYDAWEKERQATPPSVAKS